MKYEINLYISSVIFNEKAIVCIYNFSDFLSILSRSYVEVYIGGTKDGTLLQHEHKYAIVSQTMCSSWIHIKCYRLRVFFDTFLQNHVQYFNISFNTIVNR